MLKYLALFSVVIGTYHFVSFKAALMSATIIFLYFIYQLKLFQSIKFSLGYFPETELFYGEYLGEYKNIGNKFLELTQILMKFQINDANYSQVGIYYDNPEKVKDPKKCRAVYGIARTDQGTHGKDLEDYLLKSGFKKAVIPGTQCLTSLFEYVYKISMIIGIVKYYKALTKNMGDEGFKRQFTVRGNFQGSVEVYTDKSIQFFMPYENEAKFNLTTLPQPEYN